VLLFQIVYEVFSLTDLMEASALGCTTVCHQLSDGVVHARTLDWCWLEGLEELLVTLSVVRSGVLVYKCTSVLGYLGVLTGMRHGAFSISLNYRRPFVGVWRRGEESGEIESHMENTWTSTMQSVAALGHAMIGAWPVSSLIRHVLENCEDFSDAVEMMKGARLIAPCFITIAGCDRSDGVILTCDSGTGKHEQSVTDPGANGIVAVSNLDPHQGEFPTKAEALLDGPACGPLMAKDVCQGESLLRRDFAIKWLRLVQVATCKEGINSASELIKTVPVANEATLYDTVMCPATGEYRCDRSAGVEMMVERGFDGDMCSQCCIEDCEEPTACHQGREEGTTFQKASVLDKIAHGSLVRRRGGAYYCAGHLVLGLDDLSTA